MALTKLDLPTLKELFERTRDDYDTRLPGEGARIRRSFLYVTSAVLSGAVHGLYKLADRVAELRDSYAEHQARLQEQEA